MQQLTIAAAAVVAALVVAAVLRHRRAGAAPTQRRGYVAPVQIDPADFPDLRGDWLVVVFTSATCATCADIARKAAVLNSDQVGVAEVEYSAAPQLHARYGIEAVPMVVVADRRGVVAKSWIGPVSATDLWAGVAEAREPGSTPAGVIGHCHADGAEGAALGPPDHAG